jgi:hypothetical protein
MNIDRSSFGICFQAFCRVFAYAIIHLAKRRTSLVQLLLNIILLRRKKKKPFPFVHFAPFPCPSFCTNEFLHLQWAVTIRPGPARPGKESRDERTQDKEAIPFPSLPSFRAGQPAARPVLSWSSSPSPEAARGLVFLKPWPPPSTVPGNAPQQSVFHSILLDFPFVLALRDV